tara:strand:- start:2899 stop:3261 length:363 start_codon:yes stop_codon:yes gene_type:complete
MSNDTKNILVNSIKDWLTLNTKLNSLQKELKEIRNEKKNLESSLINIMENNSIDEFTINNGKLVYRKTKTKNPINKEYLHKILEDYFKKNPEIDSTDVTQFILENRTIKENSSLVIKENK